MFIHKGFLAKNRPAKLSSLEVLSQFHIAENPMCIEAKNVLVAECEKESIVDSIKDRWIAMKECSLSFKQKIEYNWVKEWE